jgi:hypothetical protein
LPGVNEINFIERLHLLRLFFYRQLLALQDLVVLEFLDLVVAVDK